MTTAPTLPTPPSRTSTLDATDEGRALLQERLGLFAKTIFWLCGSAFAFSVVVAALYPEIVSPQFKPATLIAVLGISALGLIWFVLRGRPRPAPYLRALDATIVVGAGLLTGSGAYLAATSPAQLFLPFTVGILLIFARVFIVPSGATRTFVLTIACMAPLSLGDMVVCSKRPDLIGMPMELYTLGCVVISGLTTTLATIGSRVIYGLRREVREAQRFGQYTLDRKLGEGGMGVVYKAHHALLRRPTALKLLPPDKASAADIARFEREVQLTSELTHPNTISIYDYGRSADGAFYYVMEYLDGIDLERLVGRCGALSSARAVPILIQICEALDEAHTHGVIHRDIKPANVILCRRGQVPDFVKVVDFGLVKEVARGGGENVTAAGTIAGTPAYLAPESLTSPDEIGPAIDLYAVGAIGYFLITGRQVFEGKTVMEICGHHIHTTPLPPSKRIDGPVNEELERLLLSCLAKSPTGRPASARILSDALSQVAIEGWTKQDARGWWETFELEARDPPGIEIDDTIAVMPRM